MPPERERASLALSDEQREQPLSRRRSTCMRQGLAQGACIVLARAEGLTNPAAKQRHGTSGSKAARWRSRFLGLWIESLRDEACPGRPGGYENDTVAS